MNARTQIVLFEDITIDNDLFSGEFANVSRCIVIVSSGLLERHMAVYEKFSKALIRLRQIQKRFMVLR